MSEQITGRHFLPLLQPAQAQKHVTVNESLLRLDGLVNLVLQGTARVQPPAVVEGECWGVPAGAMGAWEGQAGRIAIGANGGWVFATPRRGQRAFVLDRGAEAVWDGQEWRAGALTLGPWGGGISAGILEAEVAVGTGAVAATGVEIPSHVLVLGVTARVVEAITGTLDAWALGVEGAADRYGSGLGLGVNSWSQGLLSAPMAVWAPEELLLTALGGAFAGGRLRLAVHYLALRVPDAV
ncbi:MAG TPA: DUF2793 domain-containing protein [Paracoccus solventivorans]|uniref:DUF2793 domain-containing protein n=1 Tax=Paracoccus solventivorans TaxID=53463 RepID=A0A832QW48_9RHOB|nr:DUF2793 domain-containing protein [Paracoccus solventivorans]HHW33466.1 DUF2793 domain-containing protein [Paracoccus solventivorans]